MKFGFLKLSRFVLVFSALFVFVGCAARAPKIVITEEQRVGLGEKRQEVVDEYTKLRDAKAEREALEEQLRIKEEELARQEAEKRRLKIQLGHIVEDEAAPAADTPAADVPAADIPAADIPAADAPATAQ